MLLPSACAEKSRHAYYKYKIIYYYLLASLSIVLIVVYAMYHTINEMSRRAVVEKTASLAQIIASNYTVKRSIAHNDQKTLNKVMGNLFRYSNADYIAISNAGNIWLYHTRPGLINKSVPDLPDSKRLRGGHFYTETKKGASGIAVSTRAPVFLNDTYLGYIAVGFLEKDRHSLVFSDFFPLCALLLTVIAIILTGSMFSWRLLIKQMSGLSPEVINYRYQIRRAILNAICDGVIAINAKGDILVINQAALALLALDEKSKVIVGRNITDFVMPADCFIADFPHEYNEREVTFNGATFIATRTVIINEFNEAAGSVINLKERNSQLLLTSMIKHIKNESDALRVVSHEFRNKMAVISGFIELEEYERVKKYIFQENRQQQRYREDILQAFHASCVAGLVLGKMSRAREAGVELLLDPCCRYQGKNLPVSDEEMACIIGNILDNALEATIKMPKREQKILFYLNDGGDEIVLTVQDNGPGIDTHSSGTIFSRGVTAKKEPNHGIGLYLVNKLVENAHGECIIEPVDERGGTIFSVYIPNAAQQALHTGTL